MGGLNKVREPRNKASVAFADGPPFTKGKNSFENNIQNPPINAGFSTWLLRATNVDVDRWSGCSGGLIGR